MSDTKVSLQRRPIVIQIQGWYPILIMGLVMILMTAGNLAWTWRVDQKAAEREEKARLGVVAAERESDRQWCALLNLVARASGSATPATDPAARALQEEYAKTVAQLRQQFGCG